MPKKPDIDYSPDQVERGLRDFIAFETRCAPNVRLESLGKGVYRVHASLAADTDTDRAAFERDLTDLLPTGYLLDLTWTN